MRGVGVGVRVTSTGGDCFLSHMLCKHTHMRMCRCMTQARYFGSGEVAPVDYYHYGLASLIYTHFTSPIRR